MEGKPHFSAELLKTDLDIWGHSSEEGKIIYPTIYSTGPGCSKLTTSLVNVLLNSQKLISEIGQYFLLKKCEKLLQCKSFSHFFQQKISVYLVIK